MDTTHRGTQRPPPRLDGAFQGRPARESHGEVLLGRPALSVPAPPPLPSRTAAALESTALGCPGRRGAELLGGGLGVEVRSWLPPRSSDSPPALPIATV